MPLTHYECLVLLDSSKISGGLDTARQQMHTILEKHGVEIIASRPWDRDRRKLAYPINGQSVGQYYLLYYQVESTKVPEIEQDMKLNELMLRFMTIRIPDKWVEETKAIAVDETRQSMISFTEDMPREPREPRPGDPVGVGADGDEGMEERPRGPRRRDGEDKPE